MSSQGTEPKLRRELTLIDAISVGLGAIIGAGIFVVIGLAAGLAGPAVVLSVVIAGISATFTALSFCELGASLPKAGGVYEYGHTLLHPLVGFVMGWIWVSGNIVLGATASLSFGFYLASAFPWVDPKLGAVALIATVTVVNILGAKLSAGVNNVIVAGKVLALVVFVLVGLSSVNPVHFQNFMPGGFGSVVTAAALFYFAYIGFPRISTMAEEIVEPEKNIPRGILAALFISMAIYVAVAVVAVGLVGYEALASSTAPIATAAEQLGVKAVVEAGALLATFSVVLTSVMGQSRVFFAMARNREIPSSLARVSEKFGTPVNSILLSGAIMLVLALTVDISGLASLTSFSVLFTHMLTNIAAIKLHGIGSPKKSYAIKRVPLHAYIGAVLSLALALSLGAATILAGLLNLALSITWFYFYKAFSKNQG
ncbi:amino acid permease [Infirmifilum lucidum]|uniref:Amino acid permease n=1 Tax=Infirmifilum lucidum TaxID=2776706 RepID=A0A7L9FJF2_9CREN|nr:amino acid permease [Infirmifilum lucidum]QOJ78925.1 amino acid permease [Infirmifilum lucidum]